MKIFFAAMTFGLVVTMAVAMPSGVEVGYHEPHYEQSFLGSLGHVLKVSSHLLHKTANIGGGLGALLHSSNLAAHGHEHHNHVVEHAPAVETVYVPKHDHSHNALPVYPSAHPSIVDHSHNALSVYPSAHPSIVSTYSSLQNEV